ncbi:MAG: NAD-dependent epimerase/dehydratase family protein, partial [Planctomycetes bacterium]|nr:NAD-dependent epimerase/dehydratase family protein [Planctomycetota bacterium]
NGHRTRAKVLVAVQGCELVFHVAAKAGIWGKYDDYHRANVVGTGHVVESCRKFGIRKLVHTSSPSVVFHGKDIEGADESLPYASHFDAPYPKTKMIAEKLVLDANDNRLATVALRPHLIWGPGDHHLVPRIIARAKRLRRIGRTNKLVDSVYIDNAADAHVCAAERIDIGSTVAGRAYFITNGEPRPIWDLVGGILAAANLPPVTKNVSSGMARLIASVCETVYQTFAIRREPPLTCFLVKELSTSHWFDIGAARRDLGYEPGVSIEQGLSQLRDWLALNSATKK